MIILAYIFLFATLGCLGWIWCQIEDEETVSKISIFLLILFSVLGCFALWFDVTSPTYVESTRTFLTNDYATYELNIENSSLGLVEERSMKPSRPLCIHGKGKEYYFIEFKEQ